MTNLEYKKNNTTELIISFIMLSLHIVNIVYGVNYLDSDCAEKVGGIIFNFPVWLIIVGTLGICQFIGIYFEWESLQQILALNSIAWLVIGNVLFWNGTQDCSGDLYKLGLANMIIGYISGLIGICIVIYAYCIVKKNMNPMTVSAV